MLRPRDFGASLTLTFVSTRRLVFDLDLDCVTCFRVSEEPLRGARPDIPALEVEEAQEDEREDREDCRR